MTDDTSHGRGAGHREDSDAQNLIETNKCKLHRETIALPITKSKLFSSMNYPEHVEPHRDLFLYDAVDILFITRGKHVALADDPKRTSVCC